MVGSTFRFVNPATGLAQPFFYGWFYALTGLVLFIPNLAVGIRRLHDTDRSGWWYLFALVPFIGPIIVLVWFCTRGTHGLNTYGSDPLGTDLAGTFS